MPRPVTLFTNQWADLSLKDICAKLDGLDRIEYASLAHDLEIDPNTCPAGAGMKLGGAAAGHSPASHEMEDHGRNGPSPNKWKDAETGHEAAMCSAPSTPNRSQTPHPFVQETKGMVYKKAPDNTEVSFHGHSWRFAIVGSALAVIAFIAVVGLIFIANKALDVGALAIPQHESPSQISTP